MARLFRIEPHVRSMIDEDGAVLLDLRAGKYYSLNHVAAAVWTRVENEKDESEILDELAALYGVGVDQVRSDVGELIGGLLSKGLVRASA